MAVREIKTTLAVDGERAFNKAVTEAGRNMRVMASDMKAAASEFNLTGDEMEYLGRKSKSLNSQIEQQKEIIKALETAVADSAKAYGDASSKTDGYRIKLNNAKASLSKLESELGKTQKEAEELGRDSMRVGRQLEEGIGESAEEVGDKLQNMTKQVETGLSDISGSVQFSAFKDAYDMASGAMDSVASFVESTEDYRRQLSFLKQNAEDSGFDFSYIKEQLFGIASLTGDVDGAFEAISNLMAAGFDGKELEEAIDLIAGAVIRFPETMKFENLAESLQESVKSGSATGAYAELLERLGVNLDDVNQALANAKTEEERQQIALAYLNKHGLEDTVKNYKDMNANMLAAEEAQLKYNESLASLGEALEPVATKWVEFKTSIANGVTGLINGGFDSWVEDVKTDLEDVRTSMDNWMRELVGEDLYDKWFGKKNKPGTPGEYAGLAELGEAQGKTYGSAYGAAAQAEVEQAIATLDELASENATTIGSNVSVGMGNGIAESAGTAVAEANSLWESIKAALTKTITIPKPEFNAATYNGTGTTTASSYAAGGQNNTVTVVTQIDGDTVAASTASGVSARQAQQAQRASTYGR